jgi:hypothetical protein
MTDGHLRLPLSPDSPRAKASRRLMRIENSREIRTQFRVQFELQRVGAEVLTACIIVYT